MPPRSLPRTQRTPTLSIVALALTLLRMPVLLAQVDGAPTGPGVWSGRVLERMDALPVAHVVVRLLDLNGYELLRTRTGNDGTYTMAGRSGAAIIEVCVPGGMTLDRMVVCRSEEKQKHIKDLFIDSRAQLPVFLITRDAESGDPACDATVLITSKQGDRTFFQGRTDSSGVGRGMVNGFRYGRESEVQVTVNKEGYFERAVLMGPDELAFFHWDLAGVKNESLTPLDTSGDRPLPSLLKK